MSDSERGGGPDDERARRHALNEALARDVNELVDDVAAGWLSSEEPVEFRCECVQPDCEERVPLTREEYATVRDDPLTFVVMPGHESAELEVIVAHVREYPIVRKQGLAATVAEATAPGP